MKECTVYTALSFISEEVFMMFQVNSHTVVNILKKKRGKKQPWPFEKQEPLVLTETSYQTVLCSALIKEIQPCPQSCVPAPTVYRNYAAGK